MTVAPEKIICKGFCVEVGYGAALDSNYIGVNERRALEQTLNFLACGDMTFVRKIRP